MSTIPLGAGAEERLRCVAVPTALKLGALDAERTFSFSCPFSPNVRINRTSMPFQLFRAGLFFHPFFHLLVYRPVRPEVWDNAMTLRLTLAAAVVALFVSPALSAPAPSVPAYVKDAVANPHRPETDTRRDADRLPLVMLGFSGIRPGMMVAELVPAQGYATRLLSGLVGPTGHVYSINIGALPQQVKDQTKPVLADPNFTNVSYTEQDLSTLKVPGSVDAVWTSQNYHDMKNPGAFQTDTAAMNKAIYAALKPGGLYLIIDHVAETGSGARDTGTLHRIDSELVKKEVMSAGFEFVGETKALGNPNDPHTARVPGQGNIGDKSDKFYLKFRKPN